MQAAHQARPPRRWLRAGVGCCCAVLLLAMPALAGCSGPRPDTTSASAGTTSGGSLLADPTGVEALLADPTGVEALLADPTGVEALLAARFGGSPTMRRLTIWADAVAAEVRDPAKPENLDTHSFRGGQWTTAPVRVSMSEIEELDARVFTLADLDLTKVPGLIAMALEGLDLEGESVSSVSFDRIAGEPARVYIGVDGLRGSGSLIAGADGSDPHIRRN